MRPRLFPSKTSKMKLYQKHKIQTNHVPLFLSTHPFQVCPPTSSCRYRHPPHHRSSPPRHRQQQRWFRHLATASMRSGRPLEPVASLAQISVQHRTVDLPCRAHRGPLLHLRSRPLRSLQSRNLRHLARSIGYVSTDIGCSHIFFAYLVTHCEPAVVRRWQPHIANKRNVSEIDNVQPSVKDEPSCLPVPWNEVWVSDTSKCDTVEEEECEDDSNAKEYADPELAVHASLDILLALCEILNRVR